MHKGGVLKHLNVGCYLDRTCMLCALCLATAQSFKQTIVVADVGQSNTAGVGQEEVTKHMSQYELAALLARLCYQIQCTLHVVRLLPQLDCAIRSCSGQHVT